jgi:TonB family protein
MTSEKTLDWMEGLARNLIHHAARRAPGPLSERLTEEWLADMSERPLGFPRLRFALGCCWATSVIAREYGAQLPVASAALAPASLGGSAQLAPAFFPRRTATFLLVASLHAAILGGLMLGLTSSLKKPIPVPFQTRIIDPVHPPIDLPTIDKPIFTDTVIVVPRLFDPPPIDPDPPVVTKDETEAPAAVDTGRTERIEPAAHTVSRVQGGPGIGFPSADEFYPSAAIRKEEQGVATISACVDSKGRLTSNPAILESTGSATLDDGALRLARAGSGHYQASTEDGRPVTSCYSFRIRFALRKH